MADPHTPPTAIPERPANWSQGGGDVKLTSARSSDPALADNPQELCGVEGNSVDTAWQTTTGRPSTVIAVTDSGIEWCDPALVDKIYLNRDALPLPENAQGQTKAQLEATGQHFARHRPLRPRRLGDPQRGAVRRTIPASPSPTSAPPTAATASATPGSRRPT